MTYTEYSERNNVSSTANIPLSITGTISIVIGGLTLITSAPFLKPDIYSKYGALITIAIQLMLAMSIAYLLKVDWSAFKLKNIKKLF